MELLNNPWVVAYFSACWVFQTIMVLRRLSDPQEADKVMRQAGAPPIPGLLEVGAMISVITFPLLWPYSLWRRIKKRFWGDDR